MPDMLNRLQPQGVGAARAYALVSQSVITAKLPYVHGMTMRSRAGGRRLQGMSLQDVVEPLRQMGSKLGVM